mmetsp:Transcript_31037/g.47070  ORF Transcript_31037/g.47070 Transcript_31037/m.47070 type:complete len:86 (+) Transcript_31037:259-516(+)
MTLPDSQDNSDRTDIYTTKIGVNDLLVNVSSLLESPPDYIKSIILFQKTQDNIIEIILSTPFLLICPLISLYQITKVPLLKVIML